MADAHPGSYSLNAGGFACHWQNRWADHSPPSIDKDRNVWNFAPLLHMLLWHGA